MQRHTRRSFLRIIGASAAALAAAPLTTAARAAAGDGQADVKKPNFIIIYVDDMGYGDVGCFGSKVNRTPAVDRMAAEGMRLTSFYVTSGVCTPSRSSLMTGCYPRRVNLHQDEQGRCVLMPAARKGLNPNEITIAELLKARGYATCCIGKWHLGDQLDFLPTRQGFDHYYGIPYSNDMGKKEIPLPLMIDETVVEAPADQDTLTRRYTEEAVKFITASKDRPFFLYLPHFAVHLPLHVSDAFRGKSANGRYGDMVEEVDWSTGEILKTLKQLGLDERTMVVFTSDNGSTGRNGGSNAPLRGCKGQTLEGGQRVPCVARWPGHIPAGQTCDEIASTIDMLPTIAGRSGGAVPDDRVIDGRDIWPLLSGQAGAKTPHDVFYYYQIDQLQAVRSGKWKLHLPLKTKKKNWGKPDENAPLELYDLDADIHEDRNLADQNPDVVKRLTVLAEKARADLGDMGVEGAHQRPAGWVEKATGRLLPKKE